MAELIPRDVLFGNPERVSPHISPDGSQLAWIAPRDGVLNVWVAPIATSGTADGAGAPGTSGVDWDAAKVVTDDTDRGVRVFAWARDGRHLLYLQDTGGDENWRLYDVDMETMARRDLTPDSTCSSGTARTPTGGPCSPSRPMTPRPATYWHSAGTVLTCWRSARSARTRAGWPRSTLPPARLRCCSRTPRRTSRARCFTRTRGSRRSSRCSRTAPNTMCSTRRWNPTSRRSGRFTPATRSRSAATKPTPPGWSPS